MPTANAMKSGAISGVYPTPSAKAVVLTLMADTT
jgi:hypothetical protein